MRRIRRIILYTVCIASLALSALLLLQGMGMIRPRGIGWGDGVTGHAYSIAGHNGLIVLRSASGMKQPPPGDYAYGVQTLSHWDATGIVYHRWNMTAGVFSNAMVLGTYSQLELSGGWLLLFSVLLGVLCIADILKHRRSTRDPNRCRKCGYDLRATPDRCPECGLVPATIATQT